MVLVQQEILIRNGYDIGIGVDMATGSPMALGATGTVTAPQVGTGGSEVFTFRRLQTTGDLETELGIGADVSAGIGLFSASGSLDFTKRCRIQSSSLAILISAQRTFSFQQMDSPELSPAAAKRVADGQVDQFADQFGDYFVRGVSTGGRFFGVVRIDTKSTQSKMDLDAALSGSYGLTIDASVRTHISEAVSQASARTEAFLISDGGTISTHPASDDPWTVIDQMFTAMDEWSRTVKDDPRAYTVTLAPYAVALGPPPPNLADLEHQRGVLIRCAKLRSQTTDRLNLVEYVLDPQHTAEFEIVDPPAGPDLPALQAALAGDLDVIADAASYAIDNVKDAVEPETYMRTVRQQPSFALTSLPSDMPHQRESAPIDPTAPAWTQRVVPGLPAFKAVTTVRRMAGTIPTMYAVAVAADGRLFATDDDPATGVGPLVVTGTFSTVSGPAELGAVDVDGAIYATVDAAGTVARGPVQLPVEQSGGSKVVSTFVRNSRSTYLACTEDGRLWASTDTLTHQIVWSQVELPTGVGARKVCRSLGAMYWVLPTEPGAGIVWRDESRGTVPWQQSTAFAWRDIALDISTETLWMVADDGSVWTTTSNPDQRTQMPGSGFVAVAGGFQEHLALGIKSDGTLWDLRRP